MKLLQSFGKFFVFTIVPWSAFTLLFFGLKAVSDTARAADKVYWTELLNRSIVFFAATAALLLFYFLAFFHDWPDE